MTSYEFHSIAGVVGSGSHGSLEDQILAALFMVLGALDGLPAT